MLLTYKSHLVKETYKEWLCQKTHRVCSIRMAHETGDKCNPYAHTHVVVDFTRIFQTTDAHYFCYGTDDTTCKKLHPNIRFLRSVKAYEDALVYISKEDPDNADLAKKVTLADRIWECPNPLAALRSHMERPGDAAGILAAYALKADKEIEECDEPNFAWHRELLQEISAPAPLRTVIWYYDSVGNTGKTWLLRYLEDHYRSSESGSDWFPLAGIENVRESSNLMLQAQTQGWNHKGIIIDLTRSYEFGRKLYDALEAMKNGRLSSTKYQGGRIRMARPPWVIVLANWWPNTAMMSQDRWDIREILRQGDEVVAIPRPRNYHQHRSEGKHPFCQTCTCDITLPIN